ncbi:hypothetical protein BST96_01645 [Oceanicoccus sagamiensis]|uniref:Fatty acid desaturase domain-containing protein n=1 Tax=Oceanicoccus sagamiensis TaxID=716816 RepID=A0A1X9N435_9GAMM|nr:fatty acid desaturase [Oceanicoccus sagamiensis]ARN72920.1 hypothetical protein BST96_01645 [Oceanicoccus sagamiensis]
MNEKPGNSDHSDDPEGFKRLLRRPAITWPTIVLLLAAYTLFGIVTFAYMEGALSLFWAIMLNATASYMSFAVVHEAAHRAVSSNSLLNDWLGRAGILLLEPAPLLPVFRCVHMQHHRFTNDPAKDPDVSLSIGPVWLLPFKWMTFDVIYFKYYLKPEVFNKRRKSERIEFYLAMLFGGWLLLRSLWWGGWSIMYCFSLSRRE